MLSLVRSFLRIDIVARVLIVIVVSSLVLPLLPGPAEASTNLFEIDARFVPSEGQAGTTASFEADISSQRFSAPVTVELKVFDKNGRSVYSEKWYGFRSGKTNQPTSLTTNFVIPAGAGSGDTYRASLSVRYASFLLAQIPSAANLRVIAPSLVQPTSTNPPATATTTAPTATAQPTAASTATATDTSEPTQAAPAIPGGIQLPAPAASVLRVNSGGQSFVDSRGLTWWSDAGFSGGGGYLISQQIANTDDDALYASERWGTFSYSFDVPNGSYDLRSALRRDLVYSAGRAHPQRRRQWPADGREFRYPGQRFPDDCIQSQRPGHDH